MWRQAAKIFVVGLADGRATWRYYRIVVHGNRVGRSHVTSGARLRRHSKQLFSHAGETIVEFSIIPDKHLLHDLCVQPHNLARLAELLEQTAVLLRVEHVHVLP